MEANKLIQVINGMLLTSENEPKMDKWVNDFLNHIKSTLEEQQEKIEGLNRVIKVLSKPIKS